MLEGIHQLTQAANREAWAQTGCGLLISACFGLVQNPAFECRGGTHDSIDVVIFNQLLPSGRDIDLILGRHTQQGAIANPVLVKKQPVYVMAGSDDGFREAQCAQR